MEGQRALPRKRHVLLSTEVKVFYFALSPPPAEQLQNNASQYEMDKFVTSDREGLFEVPYLRAKAGTNYILLFKSESEHQKKILKQSNMPREKQAIGKIPL